MPDQFAYVSSHPDVLEAWDKHEAALEERRSRIKAWSDETGRGLFIVGWPTLDKAVGISRLPDERKPPEGWREPEGDKDYLVPNKRTKAGKEQVEWLESFSHENVRAVLQRVGMPADVMGVSKSYNPGVRRIGNVVYVTYSIDVDNMIGEQWERILLSAYYAIVEAVDAENEPDDAA